MPCPIPRETPAHLGDWRRTVLGQRDPYPLKGLFFCGHCDQPFFPSTQADGTRAYRSRCGCRLHPIDATEVDHRVYAEAERFAFGQILTTPGDHLSLLATRMFDRVTLGTTTDDIRFIHRT